MADVNDLVQRIFDDRCSRDLGWWRTESRWHNRNDEGAICNKDDEDDGVSLYFKTNLLKGCRGEEVVVM